MLYAIDRTTINAKILHGAPDESVRHRAAGHRRLFSADLCKLTPYDPARAKAELALAKKDFGGTIPNDGKLTLTYQTSGQAIVNEYTEIQSEWAAVGINVTLKGQPFNDWVTTGHRQHHPPGREYLGRRLSGCPGFHAQPAQRLGCLRYHQLQ